MRNVLASLTSRLVLTVVALVVLVAVLIGVAATAALTTPLHAQEITEFRIGLLGGENAQDRMASNECLRDYAEQALGVPVRLFTPADYNGVIQGLLGGSLDMAWLGASAYAAVYVADPEAEVARIKRRYEARLLKVFA